MQGPKTQPLKKENWRGTVLILFKANLKSTNPVNGLSPDDVCNRHGEFVLPSLFPIKSPIRASYFARGWRMSRYRHMKMSLALICQRGWDRIDQLECLDGVDVELQPVFVVSWIYGVDSVDASRQAPKMSSLALPLWVESQGAFGLSW